MRRVCLEACSQTALLQQGLSAEGVPAICIEARQAKAAMGAMPNKTDRNDARAIAQIIRTGWYRAVHVKSPSCRSWRALLTARRALLNAEIGYRINKSWRFSAEFLNLLNRRDDDITYAYESRTAPTAASAFTNVSHPVEPFQVRFGLHYTFGSNK